MQTTDRLGPYRFGFLKRSVCATRGLFLAQDPVGLGRIAAELVFRRMDGDREPPRRIELPTVLLPRGSGETGPRTGR